MSDNNALAPLLTAASKRYQNCDLPIAGLLSRGLERALERPVINDPTLVPACARLPAMLASGHDPLLTVAAQFADQLHWRQAGRGRIPQEIASGMAAVQIVGPDGMVESNECRFGLFLQAEQIYYPEHCHEAEELYLVLSGTAEWGTDVDPLRPVAPGSFIHHKEWQPHIMSTQEEPLLAMWGWTGNLDFSTYTMGRRAQSS